MGGKAICVCLVDGVPIGALTAEITHWTGKVVVAPRSQPAELPRWEEVRRSTS